MNNMTLERHTQLLEIPQLMDTCVCFQPSHEQHDTGAPHPAARDSRDPSVDGHVRSQRLLRRGPRTGSLRETPREETLKHTRDCGEGGFSYNVYRLIEVINREIHRSCWNKFITRSNFCMTLYGVMHCECQSVNCIHIDCL